MTSVLNINAAIVEVDHATRLSYSCIPCIGNIAICVTTVEIVSTAIVIEETIQIWVLGAILIQIACASGVVVDVTVNAGLAEVLSRESPAPVIHSTGSPGVTLAGNYYAGIVDTQSSTTLVDGQVVEIFTLLAVLMPASIEDHGV